MKPEFLMLANKMKHAVEVNGWLCSVKLDGLRMFWDGGISRGVPKKEVPWANTKGDYRFVKEPVATGLWTRYGNVVNAPEWFLDMLPKCPLDGEAWAGRGNWNLSTSIVRSTISERDWTKVAYAVFECPHLENVFATRFINNVNFIKHISWQECNDFIHKHASSSACLGFRDTFETNIKRLRDLFADSANLFLHKQEKIRYTDVADRLEQAVANGDEGLMFRHPTSFWVAGRSRNLLKYKPFIDDEAEVVGWTWGIGKHSGRMGSLRVVFNGVVFDLSGFTDSERIIIPRSPDAKYFDYLDGKTGDSRLFELAEFPIGSKVTFMYRELSPDGVPKEARYQRKYNAQ